MPQDFRLWAHNKSLDCWAEWWFIHHSILRGTGDFYSQLNFRALKWAWNCAENNLIFRSCIILESICLIHMDICPTHPRWSLFSSSWTRKGADCTSKPKTPLHTLRCLYKLLQSLARTPPFICHRSCPASFPISESRVISTTLGLRMNPHDITHSLILY